MSMGPRRNSLSGKKSNALGAVPSEASAAPAASLKYDVLSQRIADFGELVQATWGKGTTGVQIFRAITSESLREHEANLRRKRCQKALAFATILCFLAFILYK